MGFLIFFWNDLRFDLIPFSLVVLCIHSIYILTLLWINPYRRSLRIHSVGIYVNQLVCLVFLIVINLINMVDVID